MRGSSYLKSAYETVLQLLFCGGLKLKHFHHRSYYCSDAVLCWFSPSRRAAMCTTNAPVLSFLALKLLLSLDRTGHPRRPRKQPHLLAKSHNPQPLFPLLLCLQLLHRDTASPRKFPPWPFNDPHPRTGLTPSTLVPGRPSPSQAQRTHTLCRRVP